jgi:hypothetical protein
MTEWRLQITNGILRDSNSSLLTIRSVIRYPKQPVLQLRTVVFWDLSRKWREQVPRYPHSKQHDLRSQNTLILIPPWELQRSHFSSLPNHFCLYLLFPTGWDVTWRTFNHSAMLNNSDRCPHDVTEWRHEDRQLWPLPRFTKPLSRGWLCSQGGDNPCAAALMTQDAPLGYQTGWLRFCFRCFMCEIRCRHRV